MSVLGINIKNIRKKKIGSQDAMAQLLGIPRSTYAEWEGEDAIEPKAGMVQKISEILEIPVSELFNKDLQPEKLNNLLSEDQSSYIRTRRNLKNGTVDILNQLPYEPIPNHDIDIAASESNIELFDDKNTNPEDYYYIPEFSGCRSFNCYSDSMEPKIPKGCKIFARKIEDWSEVLELGQTYAIGLHDGRRFLKVIKKSQIKDNFLMHSENTQYDDWDLPKSKIRSVWLIDGWMNKATQSTYFVLKLDKNNKMKK